MARRFRRSRTQPDRGWWIESGSLQLGFPLGATGGFVDAQTVLTHENITSEGLLAQDKSDWFVKRVIIDAYPALAAQEEFNENSVARLWSLAVGVMDSEAVASWIVNGTSTEYINSPSGYERWARMFRAYNRPVYRTATLKLTSGGDPAFAGRPYVETDDPGSGTAGDYRIVGEPWGPASIHDDFTVSNAGVKDRQGLYVIISPEFGASGQAWSPGDTLTVRCILRVLLQQRRGA